MKKALQEIFDSLLDDLNKNIESFKNDTLAESSTSVSFGSVGSKEFTFHLDDQGRCSQESSAYGAGISVNYTLTIFNPEAIYSITIRSSDGGGGVYTNIHANQPMIGIVKSSFWHSTKLTVAVEADIRNVDVTAKIEYSY